MLIGDLLPAFRHRFLPFQATLLRLTYSMEQSSSWEADTHTHTHTHTHNTRCSSSSFIVTLSPIRWTACTRAQLSGSSSTTNAHSVTGQMAVCCQNLTLDTLSSRSASSMLVGALFKKFGFFFNTPRMLYSGRFGRYGDIPGNTLRCSVFRPRFEHRILSVVYAECFSLFFVYLTSEFVVKF
jgi:hypothetical protein